MVPVAGFVAAGRFPVVAVFGRLVGLFALAPVVLVGGVSGGGAFSLPLQAGAEMH